MMKVMYEYEHSLQVVPKLRSSDQAKPKPKWFVDKRTTPLKIHQQIHFMLVESISALNKRISASVIVATIYLRLEHERLKIQYAVTVSYETPTLSIVAVWSCGNNQRSFAIGLYGRRLLSIL